MPKVALIETKPSRTDFVSEFDNQFEFDRYQLCSDPSIKKVLKRDCDIDINTDNYDWVVLVGSDALKYFTKINSVTEYTGKKVDGKFLPVINPSMLKFKPEARKSWESSKESIIKYIKGEIEDVVIDETIARGIQDTAEAKAWILNALADEGEYIALDSETTGLYPRNGYMLGLSMSYNGQHGVYIDTECFDDEIESLLRKLFLQKKVIFHNAKFDIAFFQYHFNFEFPDFEDTMLLHYLIDENPGGHGLKQLAIKFTPYGDYEKPMYDWIDQHKRANGLNAENFSWDMIPFDTMKTYAAMDAVCTYVLYEKFVKIKQNPKLKWVYDNIFKLSRGESDKQRETMIEDLKDRFRFRSIEDDGSDPAKEDEEPEDVEESLENLKNELKNKGGRPREGNTYKKDKHPYGRDPLGDEERKKAVKKENKFSAEKIKNIVNGVAPKRKFLQETDMLDESNIIDD